MKPSQNGRGFALIELIVLLVIVAILAAALAASITPSRATLSSQAQRLARDIRHMQTLAQTWGRPLRLTATAGVNGSYAVTCVTPGVAPCDLDPLPVLDPATGAAFSVAVQQDVTLTVSTTANAFDSFDSQGRPITSLGAISTAATTYSLTAGTATVAVAVAPITGFVSVTP